VQLQGLESSGEFVLRKQLTGEPQGEAKRVANVKRHKPGPQEPPPTLRGARKRCSYREAENLERTVFWKPRRRIRDRDGEAGGVKWGQVLADDRHH
jgi:hypothetical protein